jgi:hypothetical protein
MRDGLYKTDTTGQMALMKGTAMLRDREVRNEVPGWEEQIRNGVFGREEQKQEMKH